MRLIFYFLIFISFSFCVHALDLKTAIELSIQNNKELAVLEEKINAAEYEVKAKQGLFNPTVKMDAFISETDTFTNTQLNIREDEYAVRLVQPLYNPSLWNEYRQSTINAEKNGIRFTEVMSGTILDTMILVLNISRLKTIKNITNDSLDYIKQRLNIQKKLYESNYGSKLDLIEIEVEIAQYQKELNLLDSQLHTELLKLNQATNRKWLESEFPIMKKQAELISDAEDHMDPDYWYNLAAENNSQLKLSNLDRQLAILSLEQNYNSFKPEIDLTLEHSKNRQYSTSTTLTTENSVKIGISFSFSPVNAYFDTQKSRQELAASRIEEERLKKQIKDSIFQLIISIKQNRDAIDIQLQWSNKLKEICDLSITGFRHKYLPLTQVLENSRKFNESQKEIVETILQLWESQLRLVYTTGILNLDIVDKIHNNFNHLLIY